jgi:hypothetical protein
MLTLLPHTIPDLPFAIASELHLLLFYQSTTVSLFMLERKTIVVWVLHFYCGYKSCATYFIAPLWRCAASLLHLNFQWNIYNYVPTFRKWKVQDWGH